MLAIDLNSLFNQIVFAYWISFIYIRYNMYKV